MTRWCHFSTWSVPPSSVLAVHPAIKSSKNSSAAFWTWTPTTPQQWNLRVLRSCPWDQSRSDGHEQLEEAQSLSHAKEIMFCKYIRNCRISCQYLTYSHTIIIYVGTVDNLQLHLEKCSSVLNTFCVLSRVLNDMDKEDQYIVDDLRGPISFVRPSKISGYISASGKP